MSEQQERLDPQSDPWAESLETASSIQPPRDGPAEHNGVRQAGAVTAASEVSKATPDAQPGLFLRWQTLWEPLAYTLLMVVALTMRLWNLAPRAYHHDESLHAFYSWNLFVGNGFQHNPLLHGPFQFDITALGFFLFGDNLVAPRVFPALFGTAVVILPLFLRGRLGKWGALSAAALLAFSPAMLYFSRFIRDDIFTIPFEAGIVVCLWRYVDTRKNRYLYIGAAILSLMFSTKETSYLLLAILGSFLAIWWSQGASLKPRRRPMAYVGGVAEPKPPEPQRGLLGRISPQAGFFFLLATLTAPLFSSMIGFLVEHLPFGLQLVNPSPPNNWGPGPVGAPIGALGNYVAAGTIAGVLFIASIVLGVVWRGKTWLIAFGIFWGIFFFLHTTFFSNMVGLGSGVWQGLGYWIAQQSVERGGQPWYYYFILLPLYEFLAFSVAIAVILAASRRLGKEFIAYAILIALVATLFAGSVQLLTHTKVMFAPIALGVVAITWLALRKGGDVFDWFLIYWTVMTIVLYMVAGEKMPWLLTHFALPLAFLSGRHIGRLFSSISWAKAMKTGGIAVLFLIPVLLFSIRALSLSAKWGRTDIGVWSFAGALAFTGAALLVAVYLWSRIGGQRFAQMLAVSALALMALFTVRTGIQAAYAHGDVPVDMLVYTQTSPDIARIAANIDRLATETRKGKDLSILIDTDDGFGWPWWWYLRQYKQVAYLDMKGHTGPITADVVVLNANNRSAIDGSAAKYTSGETVPFRQWFPEETYRGYTPGKFFKDLFSGNSWSRGLNFFTYRKLNVPLGHIDSVVYYSKELPRP